MKPTSAEAGFSVNSIKQEVIQLENKGKTSTDVTVLLFFLKQFYDFDTVHFVECRIEAGSCELLPVKWSPGQ